MGWTYLRHPETGGHTLIPDDPAVAALFAGRGWQPADLPAEVQPYADAGDVRTVTELLDGIAARQTADGIAEAEELKGKALDQALRDADLSTSGTADEKRARLTDAAATPTTDDEQGAQ